MPIKPPKKFKWTNRNKKEIPQSYTYKSRTNLSTVNYIEKMITDTLKYRQIFSCPMNAFQIWSYLLLPKPQEFPYEKHKDSYLIYKTTSEFVNLLDRLAQNFKIVKNGALYSLKKVDYEDYEKNKIHAKKLIESAFRVSDLLQKIPWIEMIAVTGSVAALNAQTNSDIDLLIITKPKRLFLSRLFVVLILKVLGIYWNKKDPAGKICPNIFMARNNLAWETKKQNFYTANEVSLVYPIYSKNNCYFDFLDQNKWICDYLPNFSIHVENCPTVKICNECKSNLLIDLLEFTSRKAQMAYMRKKQTKEVVQNDFIHFNIHDKTHSVMQSFYTS